MAAHKPDGWMRFEGKTHYFVWASVYSYFRPVCTEDWHADSVLKASDKNKCKKCLKVIERKSK